MTDWYKNPMFLLLAGAGVFVVYILMQNKGSPAPASTTTSTQGDVTNTNGITNTGGVAANYSYLDGQGLQHITATDPYGNLVGYASLPPDMMNPQAGQLSSYVGTMSGQYLVTPYGGNTPSYAQSGYSRPYYNAPYTL